jgi:hypothetical protein
MKTASHTVCLAGAALLLISAFLLAGSGPTRPTQRNEVATPAAAPLLVSMQASQTGAQQTGEQVPLSNAGFIGVMLEPHNGGLRVGALFPGGPAAFAGVRVGDQLVRVGGKNVESMQGSALAIQQLVPQQQATLTIQRGGKTLEVKVMPESLAEYQQKSFSEMMRRDPRDPKYSQYFGVSEADMSVELARRNFEQHHRLETKLDELTSEVQALRKEVRALKK